MSMQPLLIDTHIWIWFRNGVESLSKHEIERILDAHRHQTLYLSAISIWEVTMLEKMGKLSLRYPIQDWIQQASQGVSVVPITSDIAVESVILPNLDHKDPADRFILATARLKQLALLTHDRVLQAYIQEGYVL